MSLTLTLDIDYLIQIKFGCRVDSKPLQLKELASAYNKRGTVLHFTTSNLSQLCFQDWKIDISVEITKASKGLDGKLSLLLCAVLTH